MNLPAKVMQTHRKRCCRKYNRQFFITVTYSSTSQLSIFKLCEGGNPCGRRKNKINLNLKRRYKNWTFKSIKNFMEKELTFWPKISQK
jgi:hypothetical protein